MSWIGDFALGSTFDTKFCTVTTTGAPTTLAGSPVISAYPDNSVTQLTAGITLSVDFDSVTGLHNVRVVATSGNGYAAGSNYQLVITTGTVGGTSAVGYVVAEFSIEARSSVRPTVAGRTLDISSTGEAGVDWANVGSPTTANGLTGTTIATSQVVATVTNQLTAAQIATGVWQDATAGDFTTASSIGKTLYIANVAPGAAGGLFIAGANAATSIATALTANITGNLSGSVGSVTGAVGSVTGAVGSVTGLTASDVGAIKTKTDFLPSATAGSAGGVFIAGSNAATSVTTALTANITGNLSGSVGSVTGAVGSVTGAVGSVTANVNAVLTNGAHGGAAATAQFGGVGGITSNLTGNVTGSVGSVTGAVGSVTGAVGSVTGAVGSVTANVNAVLTNGAHGGAAATAQFGGAGGITSNLTGNVTGSVGSVTGAVGSVTGAVGSVTGAVGSVTGAVGSVTGNVGGNVVGSTASVTGAVGSVTGNVGGSVASIAVGGIGATSFAAGAIDAAAIASDAIGSAELAQSAAQEIADEVLNRDIAGGASGGARNVRSALRKIRNRVGISAGTMTIYQEDDLTSDHVATVTTAAGNPISEVDPTT